MAPEIVSGVHFISTSKIYSNISYRAIDEEADGIMGRTVNILHQNCFLGPEEHPKLSHRSRSPQRPGPGANGQIALTNLSCYLIIFTRFCFKKLRNSLSSWLQREQEKGLAQVSSMGLVISMLSAAGAPGEAVSNETAVGFTESSSMKEAHTVGFELLLPLSTCHTV